jgi:hypothetical protein
VLFRLSTMPAALTWWDAGAMQDSLRAYGEAS